MFNLKLQTGENNPILRMKALDIPKIDDSLYLLIEGMERIMGNSGIGIAAPQVGILKRVFLFTKFDDKGNEIDFVACIGPEILDVSDEEVVMEEGCLSLPGIYGDVKRPKKIKVRYLNIDGDKIEETLSGLSARVFQHEYDHIEGVLFIDRVEKGSKLRKIIG